MFGSPDSLTGEAAEQVRNCIVLQCFDYFGKLRRDLTPRITIQGAGDASPMLDVSTLEGGKQAFETPLLYRRLRGHVQVPELQHQLLLLSPNHTDGEILADLYGLGPVLPLRGQHKLNRLNNQLGLSRTS